MKIEAPANEGKASSAKGEQATALQRGSDGAKAREECEGREGSEAKAENASDDSGEWKLTAPTIGWSTVAL